MNKTHNKIFFVILAFAALTFIFSDMAGAATTTDEFDVVMAAAVANNGAIPPAGNMSASALEALLNDGDPSNDPMVLDLRTKEEYIMGHIPGATRMQYKDLGIKIEKLNTKLAKHLTKGGDNLIVSYGNTHHAKSFATYLSTQGLPVKNLSHGFASWTADETVAPGRYKRCTSFDASGYGIAPANCTTNDFPISTSNHVYAASLSGEDYPQIDCIDGPVTAADLAEITRCTFDAMYGDKDSPNFRITAAEVYTLQNDGDPSNDPFVLSNRATLWNKPTCTFPGPYGDVTTPRGHIPGATGVRWCTGYDRMELKTLDNTDFMPQDKLVVHHCWVGQSQQYGNSWYHLLGYKAVTLDWGMNSWTDNDTVRQAVINPAGWYKNDFPYDTGISQGHSENSK